MCAAKPGDARPDDPVRRFLRTLARAGCAPVAHRRPDGRRGSLCHVYALLKDTGPVAPIVVRRGTVVHDHNTDEEVAL